jgi:hypothetical protein
MIQEHGTGRSECEAMTQVLLRSEPGPAHENPTRGLGWVLVSRPIPRS